MDSGASDSFVSEELVSKVRLKNVSAETGLLGKGRQWAEHAGYQVHQSEGTDYKHAGAALH